MYIEYKSIPDYIKTSRDVKAVNKKMQSWDIRKLLSEYMLAYNQGIKEYDPDSDLEQRFKDIQLGNICIYYMLRKEFLTRMSPMIGIRSKNFIATDNKVLLDKFDKCLNAGVDTNPEKTQLIMVEIINRIQKA